MNTDARIKSLEKQKLIIRNLAHSFVNPEEVNIHSITFEPVKIFMDLLSNAFKKHIQQSAFKPTEEKAESSSPSQDDMTSSEVKRPSIFLVELKSYIAAFRHVDVICGINCVSILLQTLAEQIDPERTRSALTKSVDAAALAPKPKPSSKKITSPANYDNPILLTYMQWYAEFASTKGQVGTIHFVPSKNTYTHKLNTGFHPQSFVDSTETYKSHNKLDQLYKGTVLQIIVRKADIRFQEMLNQNRETLEKFKAYWLDDAKALEQLKKMRYMKDFISKCMAMGFMTEFRANLSRNLRQTIKTKCPTLESCINCSLIQHGSGCKHGTPNSQSVDLIADLAGAFQKLDMMLNSSLKFVSADPQTWKLLPFLQAATLWHLTLEEGSIYNAHYQGLENNGHVLAYGFTLLMQTAFSLIFEGTENFLATGQKETILVSATILNRLRLQVKDVNQIKCIDSVLVVVSMMAHNCSHISAREIEQLLPRALITSAFIKPTQETTAISGRKTPIGNSLDLVAAAPEEEVTF
ncbi:Nck-associated protein 1-like [Blyttiomyces sp. JEL0837]|nr:Nck-associated protein 1-like [Blyttiomyces sp. JEL0837]